MEGSLVDLSPVVWLAGIAAALALPVLGWLWWRQRGAPHAQRLAALTALMLFLTFDLIVVGAFTRLTDSGLGCPDWPGCYGEASPLSAQQEIGQAQQAMPTGPVTWTKAWIEMIHRYLAMLIGLLAIALAAASWRWREHLPHSLLWPFTTLAWVVVQGMFGRYTVTLKLYPAVVTLHLLGGMVLLALLVAQYEAYRRLHQPAEAAVELSAGARAAAAAFALLLAAQVTLGGWVSTNYAVLACRGFPQCNGQWWPAMDFGHGFTVLRELGRAGHGGYLPFEALIAIHMSHRLLAVAVLAVGSWLAAALWRGGPVERRHGRVLAGLLSLQLATGLSNVVLDWPLPAALFHTGGAAALVALVTSLLWRSRRRSAEPLPKRRLPVPTTAA